MANTIFSKPKTQRGMIPKLRSKLRLRMGDANNRHIRRPAAGDYPLQSIKEKLLELEPLPTSALYAELVEAQETLDALVCLPVLEYDDPPHGSKEDQERQDRSSMKRQTSALATLRRRLGNCFARL
ncbi:hypothetical protein DACRYDRAFT_108633 [Dacryopinax primogenitus]|uniref:Uncharacterized protein n=1 Tax=Dacryopinax primogenitus (strain DJM 731) TaxID=1858805 RepID=M5FW23_DACPD|nr:uncharacterized protein DACRYDRAFT_108633 [Dacryopinax primogenitus]EJU00564.1 hypothetical protein DACRYDRAFT_108633 [Dacryopinax primogenitus]